MTCYVPAITETDQKLQNRSLQQLAAGRSNAVGTVTLAASAASTTVTDPNCAAGTTPILSPSTVHASAEVGNGTIYIPVATIVNGSFVIQHASNSQTDRTYRYALVG